MNPALHAVIFGRRRQQIVLPFAASTTWTAPVTTSRIDKAIGKGADGAPAQGSWGYQLTVQTLYYNKQGQQDGSATTTYDPVYRRSPPQGDYCTGTQNSDGSRSETCYYYNEFDDYTPATTGAPTTAFGQTFPGGAGKAATDTTINNIAITPGATYNIVVPPGGSLTITYFQ